MVNMISIILSDIVVSASDLSNTTQSLMLGFSHRISSVRGFGGFSSFDRGKSRCYPAASECSDPIDEAENGDPDLQNVSVTQSTHFK